MLVADGSYNFIALATTSSRVAVGILPGRCLAHSRFKIPLQLNISKQSALATLFRMKKLIVQDEAPMIHQRTIKALDRTLHDINECNLHFGGKFLLYVVIFVKYSMLSCEEQKVK